MGESRGGGRLEVITHTLGPDLYAGTGGVAGFLAGLARATGEARFHDAARAAMIHAASRGDELAEQKRPGLYTGLTGVALAAAWIGTILSDKGLLARSKSLMRIFQRREPDIDAGFDLLSGNAGILYGLLALGKLTGRGSYVSHAVHLGDELIRLAKRSRRGWSWASSNSSGRTPNLTGLSHGTAGAGAALLELFRATGLDRYREAAQASFDYERSWFDAEHANWPHLDGTTGVERQVNAPLPFVSHWCHGAPGIALSRLRAWQILGDTQCREEAKTGLQDDSRGSDLRVAL